MEYILSRFGKNAIEAMEQYDKNKAFYNSQPHRGHASLESVYLFEEFYHKYMYLNSYLGLSKQKEFRIEFEPKKYKYYDFTIEKLKLIFEYQGEHIHPNPKWNSQKWDHWKCLYTKENAETCYNYDIEKKQSLKKMDLLLYTFGLVIVLNFHVTKSFLRLNKGFKLFN